MENALARWRGAPDKAAMVEITSRYELEEWLKDNPRECAQVIAARSALRVLPYAFQHSITGDRVAKLALALLRANAISWAARNFPAHDMRRAATDATYAAAYAAIYAADVAAAAARAADAAADVAYAADAAYAAARAADAAADAAHATARSADAAHATARAVMWANISADIDWLSREGDPVLAARRLTREPLWLRAAPKGWQDVWDNATARLTALDPSYQVWIDWYNRRITGEDAAFDISGDTDRTEDKNILIKLADATDEDFWDKGALHVNTILQSWIDEARINAEISEILVKLRAGATTHIGTSDELEARRALLDALDRLSGKPPMQHGGIGHNYPPEGLDLVETSAALQSEVRAPIEAMATELQKTEPDPIIVAETALLFHRIIRKLEKMASVAGDKFAEEFGGELGKGAGKLVTRLPYALVALPLIEPILAWLRAVIG